MLMPHEIDALIGRAQLAGDVLNYTVEITSDPPAAFEAPPNMYFFLAKLLDVHGREERARICAFLAGDDGVGTHDAVRAVIAAIQES